MKSKLINLAHGGHSGDIIYSLPFAKYLSEIHKCNVVYHVLSDRPATLDADVKHPNGNVFNMNRNSFEFIKSILEAQNFISHIKFTEISKLPSDTYFLDYFRDINGINQASGSIAYWSRKFFGIKINTELPWINCQSAPKDAIVCSFSRRYRNLRIDYNFLDNYNSYFVGLKDEYIHFSETNKLSNLKFHPVNNAIEMAKFIKSSKLFIGNQSFGFSLAEAMKVNRALEVCELSPNVIPTGKGAFEFLNTYALSNILSNFKYEFHSKITKLDCEFTLYYR